MSKRIKFKSKPEFWRKEYLGLKSNTVRVFKPVLSESEDIRKEILDDWISGKRNLITIEIENTDTYETFVREVKDVSEYNEIYIISW